LITSVSCAPAKAGGSDSSKTKLTITPILNALEIIVSGLLAVADILRKFPVAVPGNLTACFVGEALNHLPSQTWTGGQIIRLITA
jgi:hypothetical protein